MTLETSKLTIWLEEEPRNMKISLMKTNFLHSEVTPMHYLVTFQENRSQMFCYFLFSLC